MLLRLKKIVRTLEKLFDWVFPPLKFNLNKKRGKRGIFK